MTRQTWTAFVSALVFVGLAVPEPSCQPQPDKHSCCRFDAAVESEADQ